MKAPPGGWDPLGWTLHVLVGEAAALPLQIVGHELHSVLVIWLGVWIAAWVGGAHEQAQAWLHDGSPFWGHVIDFAFFLPGPVGVAIAVARA